MEKRIWRAKMPNRYIDPEPALDPSEDLQWLFEEHGNAATTTTTELPPRDDLITFDPAQHTSEWNKNIQWRDCPEEWKPTITAMIQEYWDCFSQAGMHRHIRGFTFHIDTGPTKPIDCKPPRYGPHESQVIKKLVDALQKKGIIEDDDGPYGSLVVLAGKPNQDHAHWSQYVFRLCISYRPLNGVTRPFTFPILRCDDAVEDIGGATVAITLDLDAGYWQVLVHSSSRPKTAFYIPKGKKRWKNMPMGLQNAHAFFVAMVTKIQERWEQYYDDHKASLIEKTTRLLNNNTTGKVRTEQEVAGLIAVGKPGSAVIVDDVILYARNVPTLIAYTLAMLEMFVVYRVTIKLRKTRFLPARAEFVGVDVTASGNIPAQSKFEQVRTLAPPKSVADWRMLVGFFGFYRQWIPWYEERIIRWRDKYKQLDKPRGTFISSDACQDEEETQVQELWEDADDKLLEDLKQAILDGPVLKRPDYNKRFYLKTDWSKHAMGAALLQAEDSDEAREAERQETQDHKCRFDKTLGQLRLRPVMFLSRKCKGPEIDYHSYWGETATGRWAMNKLRKYLLGREFTWITDCSGVQKFFETEMDPTHTMQRWKMEMLRFQFTIIHRPARMLAECDLLSRYNQKADALRESLAETAPNPDHVKSPTLQTMTATRWPTICHGPPTRDRTERAQLVDRTRTTSWWTEGPHTADTAAESVDIGLTPATQDDSEWLIITHASITTANMSPSQFAEEVAARQQHQKITTIIMMWAPGTDDIHIQEITRQVLNTFRRQTEWTTRRITTVGVANRPDNSQRWTTIIFQHGRQDGHVRRTEHSAITAGESCDDVLGWIPPRYDICRPRVEKVIRDPATGTTMLARENGQLQMLKVVDTDHPVEAYDANLHVSISEQTGVDLARPFTSREWFTLLGRKNEGSDGIPTQKESDTLRHLAPTGIWVHAMLTAWQDDTDQQRQRMAPVEAYGENDDAKVAYVAIPINRWTTYPTPSRQQWQAAQQEDPDLHQMAEALRSHKELPKGKLDDKRWYKGWEEDLYVLDEGLVHKWERPKGTRVRQVLRRTVPRSLRRAIIAAYHATPMAGHVGLAKTYWRIAVRFHWPGMFDDVREAVLGCAICNVANASNHEQRQKLGEISTGRQPFDVIAIDVWIPGTTNPDDKIKNKQAVLTGICTMTGFAITGFIDKVQSAEIAVAAFQYIFTPFGFPTLVMLDAASTHHREVVRFLEMLNVPYYMAPPQAHNAIMSERFHRYLNKVQKIHAADTQVYNQWKLGTLFAAYAWNASPIDGTDIVRSFVAIGKHFKFPLDVEDYGEAERYLTGREMEQAVEHIQTAFPLWFQQLEILKAINADRRKEHRDRKNATRKGIQFEVGDIVMVRKQIQSNAAEGRPAKLALAQRGPYRVIGTEGNGSYKLLKVPTTASMTKAQKKPVIERAFRMEKLPQTVVIHKRVNTADTRLVGLKETLNQRPLEHSLGFLDFGRYVQNNGDGTTNGAHAFVKYNELEPDPPELEEPSSDEDEDNTVQTPVTYTPVQQGKHKVSIHTPQTRTQRCKSLWQQIRASKDKLFIIKDKDAVDPLFTWYVVQVDLDESVEQKARSLGEYHVRWFIPNQQEATKTITKKCAYWPWVKELKPDGNFGATIACRPKKAEALLRKRPYSYGWYQKTINLVEQGVYGPFDFEARYKIPEAAWTTLEAKADEEDIQIDNLHKVAPLRKYQRQAKG